MENLKDIAINNPEIYEMLMSKQCKVTLCNSTLYEGILNDMPEVIDDKIDTSMILCEFTLEDDKKYICTLTHNEQIDKYADIIKEQSFEELMQNPKMYNKLINMAYLLPAINICEDENICKEGYAYKTLFEHYTFINEFKETNLMKIDANKKYTLTFTGEEMDILTAILLSDKEGFEKLAASQNKTRQFVNAMNKFNEAIKGEQQ